MPVPTRTPGDSQRTASCRANPSSCSVRSFGLAGCVASGIARSYRPPGRPAAAFRATLPGGARPCAGRRGGPVMRDDQGVRRTREVRHDATDGPDGPDGAAAAAAGAGSGAAGPRPGPGPAAARSHPTHAEPGPDPAGTRAEPDPAAAEPGPGLSLAGVNGLVLAYGLQLN